MLTRNQSPLQPLPRAARKFISTPQIGALDALDELITKLAKPDSQPCFQLSIPRKKISAVSQNSFPGSKSKAQSTEALLNSRGSFNDV